MTFRDISLTVDLQVAVSPEMVTGAEMGTLSKARNA